VSLKADTQAAISAAVGAGGTNVTLNVAAYDIARDTQGTAFNQGTINSFAGAGGVNGQQVTAAGQGTFIYAYTRAAIDLSNSVTQELQGALAGSRAGGKADPFQHRGVRHQHATGTKVGEHGLDDAAGRAVRQSQGDSCSGAWRASLRGPLD
jgi:hypothetical protein